MEFWFPAILIAIFTIDDDWLLSMLLAFSIIRTLSNFYIIWLIIIYIIIFSSLPESIVVYDLFFVSPLKSTSIIEKERIRSFFCILCLLWNCCEKEEDISHHGMSGTSFYQHRIFSIHRKICILTICRESLSIQLLANLREEILELPSISLYFLF